MTQKRKPKSSSPLDVLFDNVLFVKRYRFETSLPINIIVEQLNAISGDWDVWRMLKLRVNVKSELVYDQYTFDIEVSDNGMTAMFANAKTTIYPDNDKTVIVGEAHLNPMSMLLALWSVVITAYITISAAHTTGIALRLGIFILFVLPPVYLFIRLIVTRNLLIRRIETICLPNNAVSVDKQPNQAQSSDNILELEADDPETQTQVQ